MSLNPLLLTKPARAVTTGIGAPDAVGTGWLLERHNEQEGAAMQLFEFSNPYLISQSKSLI